MKKLALVLLSIVAFTYLISTVSVAQDSIFDVSNTSLFDTKKLSNDEEFLNVEEAFIFNFYQKDNQLTVSFDISEGYYLYKHQFKFKGINATFETVELPKGLDHEDEFFGVQEIYKNKLSFII